MLLFRSFVLGLLGACCLLLASRPPVEVRIVREAQPVIWPRTAPAPAASIVDIAPGLSAEQIAPLVGLAANEHVVAVDDARAGDLDAGTLMASGALAPHRYIDLSVVGPRGPRRVLVLVH